MVNMCTLTFLALCLGFLFGHVHVEAKQDVSQSDLHDLRKTVQENTEIIRLLTDRIQNLETKLAKSEEERITLTERIEVLESLAVRGGQKSTEAETSTDHLNAASEIDTGVRNETYKSAIRRGR